MKDRQCTHPLRGFVDLAGDGKQGIGFMTSTELSSNRAIPQRESAVVFRILSGDQHGRTVQIPSRHFTIGSSPSCMLRLCAPHVHPIHCAVFHGAHHTSISSLSPQTLLNGQPFVESMLQVGDRLQLGPITLELLSLTGQTSWPRPQRFASTPSTPASPAPDAGACPIRRADTRRR